VIHSSSWYRSGARNLILSLNSPTLLCIGLLKTALGLVRPSDLRLRSLTTWRRLQPGHQPVLRSYRFTAGGMLRPAHTACTHAQVRTYTHVHARIRTCTYVYARVRALCEQAFRVAAEDILIRYIVGLVLGQTGKIHSDSLPTFPLNFTEGGQKVEKVKILPRFSTPVASDELLKWSKISEILNICLERPS